MGKTISAKMEITGAKKCQEAIKGYNSSLSVLKLDIYGKIATAISACNKAVKKRASPANCVSRLSTGRT